MQKQSIALRIGRCLATAALSVSLALPALAAAAPEPGGSGYVTIYPLPVQAESEATGRLLFATQQYAAWQWHYERYPSDMSFTVLTAPAAPAKEDSLALKLTREALGSAVYRDKIVLVAALGSAAAQTDIGIEKVTLTGSEMTVRVHTKSAPLNQPLTMNITFPYDYILLDRQELPLEQGMTVNFVDQEDTLLATVKVPPQTEQR